MKLTSILILLFVLTQCNYREEKLAVEAHGGPDISTTPDPSNPDTRPPEPQDWFTALQKTVFNPKCVECHNPTDLKGDIDLTSYEALMQLDPPAVFPNFPENSSLYLVLEDRSMPPGKRPKLTAEELDSIFRWIKKGAPKTESG